jgi:Protein of unknown function (DUF1573)
MTTWELNSSSGAPMSNCALKQALMLLPMLRSYFHGLIVLSLLLSGFGMSVCSADLTFPNKKITFEGRIEENSHVVTIPFTNASTGPVTVVDIQTGCGCVTSQLDKRIYAPGESGEISITLEYRERTGAIRRKITVSCHGEGEVGNTSQDIQIEGTVPSPLKMSDLIVNWNAGEPVTTKTISVSIIEGHQIKDLHVEDPLLNAAFIVNSRPAKSGGLVLEISPNLPGASVVSLADGKDLQQAYVLVYTYLPQGIQKRERFFALVSR